MKTPIWMNSSPNVEGIALFQYIAIPTEKNYPIGTISAKDGERPTWYVGNNSGDADDVGQAKRAVETLSKVE